MRQFVRQLSVRLLVWATDIAVNAYFLGTHQAFSLGSWQLDNISFILAFNAVVILGIYFVDFAIVKIEKL